MADQKLIGQNYTPLDLVAKVTGRAKYAEDYRADGMLFCKLLLSPMPHARVTRIDATAALAMPGVKGILTADDLPPVPPAFAGAERPLTMEPFYQGEPILAVAAVDELTAAEAIERITVDYQPLPFVVDPVESLRPNGSNARLQGNVWYPPSLSQGTPPQGPPAAPEIRTLKWSDETFAEEREGRLPMGEAPEEWSFGDLEAGFREAALVLDETFVVPSTSHQTMESRSAMSYWQNGKLFLYGSTHSVIRTVDNVARWVGIEQSLVVLISE
jgi:CO/xanthine dehydrogenase Mo-binding subunit